MLQIHAVTVPLLIYRLVYVYSGTSGARGMKRTIDLFPARLINDYSLMMNDLLEHRSGDAYACS